MRVFRLLNFLVHTVFLEFSQYYFLIILFKQPEKGKNNTQIWKWHKPFYHEKYLPFVFPFLGINLKDFLQFHLWFLSLKKRSADQCSVHHSNVSRCHDENRFLENIKYEDQILYELWFMVYIINQKTVRATTVS